MQIERRLPGHLFGLRDLGWGWPPLYAFTLGLQFLTGFLRSLVAALVLLIVNVFTKWWFSVDLPVNLLALVIGYAPLFISLATLIWPFGSWFWQQALGGRTPSEREQAVLDLAMARLREADPSLRGPARWIVVDTGEANAAAYANAIAVTTRMLASPALTPTLAHELGHLNCGDARVTAAVKRLIIPPERPIEPIFPILGPLLSGRLAMGLTAIPWGAYWRRREGAADAYAARLGQGGELAGFLDDLGGDVATPWKAFGASSHPWTEHRIEALEEDED
jgi:Zn-dependent protease with chaperone function